jgi:hypothetical protein
MNIMPRCVSGINARANGRCIEREGKITRHNANIVLPPVPKLMPPLFLYYLALFNLINRPKMLVAFVQEDTLEDVILVRNRERLRVTVHSELVLIV